MRAWVPLVLLLPLAGCVDDGPQDFSTESTSITVAADGPFQVGVPLLVSGAGTSLQDWLEAFRITGNASLALRELDRGPVLWITGSGNVLLDAQEVRQMPERGPAEQYLESSWSAEGLPGGDPLFWSEDGVVDLVFGYEGTSRRCFLSVHYTSVGMAPGWNAPDETGFPGRTVQCT